MSRIMIVDDDLDVLRYCEAILASRGHEVLITTDTYKALKTLEVHPVDLLIVDIVMPSLSGFEFMKMARDLKNFNAPVVMLTGKSSPRDVLMALELGAVDYIIKPIDHDLFLGKIQSILGEKLAGAAVQFAQGSANTEAELTVSATIVSVSEMGMKVLTSNYMDRNVKTKISSTIFKDIGIAPPLLRVASCKPIQGDVKITDAKYRYEVMVSFVGLDESTMQKIRRWVLNRSIEMNRAKKAA